MTFIPMHSDHSITEINLQARAIWNITNDISGYTQTPKNAGVVRTKSNRYAAGKSTPSSVSRWRDYRTARVRGWDIGSGPTEALRKTLTLRLKRLSLKWDAEPTPAMMTLLAMRASNQYQQWWAMRARAASCSKIWPSTED